MKQALKEAEKAYNKGEVPVGAVIVKEGRIISKGYNLKETKKDTIKHAEIIAIEKKTLEAVERAFERFTLRMDELCMGHTKQLSK